MAPVARRLAHSHGILEPIQTAVTLDGQVDELKTLLEAPGNLPITLIGYSWGAWLSFIVAARYPGIVRKLILISSGPFEETYVAALHSTRMSRLSEEERAAFGATIAALGDPATGDKSMLLARLGELASKADAYDPIPDEFEEVDRIGLQGDTFHQVWNVAAEMRRSGELLTLGRRIECPVVAIHGDFDPHPAEGIEKPLAAVLGDFRFILLERCGHTPWIERQAQDAFYRILEKELT
ncbi:MAG: alpha/beta hydrolase [Anaerolineae bacterium]|nr:alpha/beta hydrolase [Anaerolineae bacterium]